MKRQLPRPALGTDPGVSTSIEARR
jgi:hypothetical protein